MSHFITRRLARRALDHQAPGVPYVPALRVLIVGCVGPVPCALRERLESSGVMTCVEARDVEEALSAAVGARLDLCVVDDRPSFDAASAVAMLTAQAPGLPVVLVGTDPTDPALLQAVAAGAKGYITDFTDAARLTAALLDVVAGRPAFPRRLGTLLIEALYGASRA